MSDETPEATSKSHGSHQSEPNSADGRSSGEPQGEQPVIRRTRPSMAQELGLADPEPVWCDRCASLAEPEGRGVCPRCKRMLPGAFMQQKHPRNKKVRDQYREKFTNEYEPRLTIDFERVDQLADVTERLKVKLPGSAEYKRLREEQTDLIQQLEASRAARASKPTNDLEHLTDDGLIAHLEGLLTRARENKALSVDVARRQAEDAIRLKQLAVTPPDDPLDERDDVAAIANASVEPCRWCNRSPCIGQQHPAYWSLHPEARAARDEARVEREFRIAFGLPVERRE